MSRGRPRTAPGRQPPGKGTHATRMSYQDRINAGLDRAYAEAPVVPIELRQLRLVIVSDLHRGAGDGADDFRLSQHALATALDHYQRTGWMLAVLGDAEELWECEPAEVVAEYRAVPAAGEALPGRRPLLPLRRQPRRGLVQRCSG